MSRRRLLKPERQEPISFRVSAWQAIALGAALLLATLVTLVLALIHQKL